MSQMKRAKKAKAIKARKEKEKTKLDKLNEKIKELQGSIKTSERKELDAIGIRDALKEEEEGRLIRKTSKMFKGGILNRTYGMKEGGFTKRGGMYKKGY